MGDPFIGEIRMVGFTFAPLYWADCRGQSMQIIQHQALYTLLGANFGGDGRTYFNLPNFQGRTPVHPGIEPFPESIGLGSQGGAEQVSLTVQNLPAHQHDFLASNEPADAAFAMSGTEMFAQSELSVYTSLDKSNPSADKTPLHDKAISQTGGTSQHENIQPSLVIRYIISLQGTYPQRN